MEILCLTLGRHLKLSFIVFLLKILLSLLSWESVWQLMQGVFSQYWGHSNVEEWIEPGNFPLSRFFFFFLCFYHYTSYQIVDLCCIYSFVGLLCMGGMLH